MVMESQGKKLSPNSSQFKRYKDTLKGLTLMQYQAAIGLILGDARIELSKSGYGALLKFEWGNVNKEYAFHVYELFLDYCLTPPRKQVRINVNGNEVTTWCFQTLSHKDFLGLANLFLINGKKIVPNKLIFNHLTEVGLAYWFIDDGGINGSHSYGIQINTQSFTVEEVDYMCTEIQQKFGLICWRGKNKGKPIVVISSKSYSIFVTLVNGHIVPSIKHKLRLRLCYVNLECTNPLLKNVVTKT